MFFLSADVVGNYGELFKDCHDLMASNEVQCALVYVRSIRFFPRILKKNNGIKSFSRVSFYKAKSIKPITIQNYSITSLFESAGDMFYINKMKTCFFRRI